MKMVLTFLKANFRQFFRDKASLFFTFAFPAIFMLIFGMIFSKGDSFTANVGLAAPQNSAVSQAMTQALGNVGSFKLKTGSTDDLMVQLKKGSIRTLIVVPEGADASIAAAQPVDIAVYYDPAQQINNQVVVPIITRTVQAIDQQITATPSLLAVKEQSIQVRKLGSIDYLVPGIIAMSILMTGLLSALPIIQQRERKVLKRLGAMPIRRSSIIYSQVIFRVIIALAQTAVLVALAHTVFKVQMLGSWLTLAGFVVLGTLAFVSLGYVVGSFIKTEEAAIPVVQLIQFPMLFLSGIFFTVDMMPGFMQPIVKAMPLSYLGDALRQIMVQWTPNNTLIACAAVLGAWVVVSLGLSTRFFKWE